MLIATRAGVDEEPHRARAIARVEALLEDLVVWDAPRRLEVPNLRIPFRTRGPRRLEGPGSRTHLRLLEGPHRLPGKPYREEDNGDEGQDQGRCTVQIRHSFTISSLRSFEEHDGLSVVTDPGVPLHHPT